jgi:hypothetical protein
MPDRSRVMTQTKRDTLVLQVGFGVGLTTPHSKKLIVTKVEQRKLILFDRRKPTVGYSASGRRKEVTVQTNKSLLKESGSQYNQTTSLAFDED